MTAHDADAPAFASPIDAFAHGEYRRRARDAHRFAARLGSRAFPAVPGRYHLYLGWSSPSSHRLAILRSLHGLDATVSVSYVDALRDGRGWAFRERTGADPVNGFTLLREAYEASRPGYDGDVSVPVLWDRVTGSIVSNHPARIGIDLATAFGRGMDTFPIAQAGEIERFDRWVAAEIDAAAAVYDAAIAARLRQALRDLDRRLATHTYLLGPRLTDADVRLWVQVVRLDAGPNAHGTVGPRLDHYPNLWKWAGRLYAEPAFRATTDFAAFTAPLAELPPWDRSAIPSE